MITLFPKRSLQCKSDVIDENMLKLLFSNKLRVCRAELSLSLEAVAYKLGVSAEELYDYEIGASWMPAVLLWEVSLIYKVDPEYFFDAPHDC